jgi:hypothetical protein
MVILSAEDQYLYADPLFMKQMLVLQKCDSNSYSFLGLSVAEQEKIAAEFCDSTAVEIREWEERNEKEKRYVD